MHGFVQTWPEDVKPCTDGSFPLIVIKDTRQVVRIEIMRADLLGWCDVDNGVVVGEVMWIMRI